MPDNFSSRDVSRLLEDIYAAVMDVQSTRSPTVKAMGVLATLHSRGWQVVPAEPIARSAVQEELEIAEIGGRKFIVSTEDDAA